MRTSTRPAVGAAAEEPVEGEFEETGTALATVRTGAALQQRTQHSTAVQQVAPRDIKALTKRVLDEAELSGEDFYYSWTQGGKVVEGPTIEAAMILARNFGNNAVESRQAEEGPTHWLFDAVFFDSETGFTLARQFRQRKGEAHQKKGGDGDRLLDIAFQIGQSKAQRNVIVKAVPGWLVAKAMEKAKAAAEDEYTKNLPATIDKALIAYGKLQVTVDELEKKIGKPTAAWTAADVRLLGSLHRGILARETSVENEFRMTPPATVPAPGALPPAVNPQQPAAPAQPVSAAAAPQPAAPAAAHGHAGNKRAREPGEEG